MKECFPLFRYRNRPNKTQVNVLPNRHWSCIGLNIILNDCYDRRFPCSIESAARSNPDRDIIMVSASPVGTLSHEKDWSLMDDPNIHFRVAQLQQLCNNTPPEPWRLDWNSRSVQIDCAFWIHLRHYEIVDCVSIRRDLFGYGFHDARVHWFDRKKLDCYSTRWVFEWNSIWFSSQRDWAYCSERSFNVNIPRSLLSIKNIVMNFNPKILQGSGWGLPMGQLRSQRRWLVESCQSKLHMHPQQPYQRSKYHIEQWNCNSFRENCRETLSTSLRIKF